MLEKIAQKATRTGNYRIDQLTIAKLADMTQQDIRNAAAGLIMKDRSGVQITSAENMSILEQAICPLPEVSVSQVNTVIRYFNVLPNGQPLISYFGATPDSATLASLTKLAKTAQDISGGILSGYAPLTSAFGEEKHYLPGTTVLKGISNIRTWNKNEIVFTHGKTVKKMTLENFVNAKWETAELVGSFDTTVLFMDRVQNGVTNIVTEKQIVQGYNLSTKRASSTQDQNPKCKVLSFVQQKAKVFVTTQSGLTQEPALARAV
ncbi:hypothetical protein HY839_02135 [Candidatus Azambacteria bacterium]|nr:hypothetical protein [Candidatus Azambacteria bacterium]